MCNLSVPEQRDSDKDIAVLGTFRLSKYRDEYSIDYWRYIYIDFLCSRYNQVYIIAPTLKVEHPDESLYLLRFPNLQVIELPYYQKYVHGMRLLRHYFSSIKALRNVDLFYCQVPSPYCWMPKLLFRKRCIIEFLGDSIDVMWKNKQYGILKRTLNIVLYLPEYFLSLLAARSSNVYSCGFSLYKRLKALGIDSTLLFSSLITDDDFYEKRFRFKGNLLYVGFLRYAKGLEILVDLVSILKEKGLTVKLNIVGDGEYKDELMRMVKASSLEEDIIFTGHIGNREVLRSYYRKGDIFLFPSLSEGSPRVVLEAMANSLPVVATPVGGLPHIFKNDVHIKFAEFNNPESFAKKIIEYISDESSTQMIVDEAMKSVKNDLAMESFLSTLFETGGR